MTHIWVLVQIRVRAFFLDSVGHCFDGNGILLAPYEGHRGGLKREERPRPTAEVCPSFFQVAKSLRHYSAAEWYAALGIVSSLIWIYLEVLLLLGRLAARQQ